MTCKAGRKHFAKIQKASTSEICSKLSLLTDRNICPCITYPPLYPKGSSILGDGETWPQNFPLKRRSLTIIVVFLGPRFSSRLLCSLTSKRHFLILNYRQRWQTPGMATELAKRVICACICEVCFFRKFMGLKSQTFSWSLLARNLYTRQLACKPQTGSLDYQLQTEERTKNDQFSRSKVYIQKHACCCFCCASMQGQKC